MIFSACVRCKGDIIIDRDIYGYYTHCLQCGNMVDISKKEAIIYKKIGKKKDVR